MKSKLLIGWTLTVLSTGAIVSCGDDDGDDAQPNGGKAGSTAGASGNAGKAGGGSGGKAGEGGSGGGKAGGGSGGRAGNGGRGGRGGSGGSTPGGQGGEAGSMAGEAGEGPGGEGGGGGEGALGGEGGLGGESAGGAAGDTGESGSAGLGGEGGSGEPPVAVLRLNELNSNIDNNRDLIELRVITAGNLGGIRVEQTLTNTTLLATLPSVTVEAGDLVVVHLNPLGGVSSETTAKDQCTGPACYDAAWDVRGQDTGLVHGNRVIAVRANGAYQDAVPFVATGGTQPAAFLTALEAIQDAGQWTPATCGGSACTYATTPSAEDISVDWTEIAATADGDSIQVTGTGSDTAAEWEVAESSFGEPNG
ncbi:MAG TPA: hypothetical protein VGK73_16010 [Polyangiaceae bacterium]